MSKLDLGQMLQNVKDPSHREMFKVLQDAINNLSGHIAADPVGETQAPQQIQGLQIKVSGESIHAVITDNNPLNKGVHYFLEADTDPNFSQPHVIHMGTSRAPLPFTLPAKDDSGTTRPFYFRAYPQYPGSKPGPHLVFGGQNPTAVQPIGSTQMTLIPSTGSGTAAANGTQGGVGFGTTQTRQAIGPKRNIPV